ncbi:unnamed protein product [Chrysodeixis includens]|uniref:Uncharacterized protein n=1 Tax=Chrysodeixis includens TaxID=689277 RepID=A0A9P0BT50_CHRIL|nr:unnamed protein product [Chrysodeixis includens]
MAFKLKYLFKTESLCVGFLKYISFLGLLLGCYKNISQSKLVSRLLKLYCISLSLVSIIVYNNYAVITKEMVFHCCSSVEFVINIIIHIIYGDEPFLNFCGAIGTFDRIMGFKKTKLFANYVYFMAFITIFLRLGIHVSRFFISDRTYTLCIETFVALSTDLSQIKTFIIFAMMHTRILLLKRYIQFNTLPLSIIGTNDVADSIKNIRKGLYYYNNILDNMQHVDMRLQVTVNTSLMLWQLILN